MNIDRILPVGKRHLLLANWIKAGERSDFGKETPKVD